MRTLAFTVYGDPVPQGSKRAFVVKQRAVVVDANSAGLKSWRSQVVSAAMEAVNDDPDLLPGDKKHPELGAVKVTLLFFLRQPKRPRSTVPITRPDLDKLIRAVFDGLTDAGVIRDDLQVTSLSAGKRYTTDTPRVQVFVDGDA